MTDRLVLLHGFTQTGASWRPVADLLGDEFTLQCPDLPGHGISSDLRLDLPAAATWLADIAGPATYVGYSMGGRMALQLAVDWPDLVERLVLVSTTAGIVDATERAARRAADEHRAEELERDGVEAFLARWLALPLFANLPPDRAQLDARLVNTVGGLTASLRLAGTGAQEPLWDRLGGLAMPTLVVAGELDTRFATIAERLTAMILNAELTIIPDAGHSLHLERPDVFVATVTCWLARHPRVS